MIIQKMEIDHYSEVKRIWTTTDGIGLRSIDDSKAGIGKKLVEEAILSLRNEGINKVALVVFKNNSGENSFWKALGFEERSDLIYRNLSLHAENI